jgi:hypothetical protein
VVKIEANNNYKPSAGQQLDFTICIINDSISPVAIQNVSDTMPNTWLWGDLTCDFSSTNATITAEMKCSQPIQTQGGGYSWGNADTTLPLIMDPGDRLDLRIHGRYLASGLQCNSPETGGIGYKVTLADTTVLSGNSACITVP